MWGIPIENYSISFMASWWSLFSAKIMWNHSTVNEKEKIMWNHFTVVIDSKFCQKETKNYVKSKQFVFLYWSNLVWQKISVKSQHSFCSLQKKKDLSKNQKLCETNAMQWYTNWFGRIFLSNHHSVEMLGFFCHSDFMWNQFCRI